MEKYRGNQDSSLILKNSYECTLYWCRLEHKYSALAPDRPQFVIKAFRPGEWAGFERLKNTNQSNWTWWGTLGNFKSMEILHDPRLVTDINELKI